MPVYGARPTGYQRNPAQGKQWQYQESEFIRDNPSYFNSWYQQQFPTSGPGSVDPRYAGFLQMWLGDQARNFQGQQLTNPNARYEDFMASRNPWQDYEMSPQGLYRGWGRQQFGTRLQRRG